MRVLRNFEAPLRSEGPSPYVGWVYAACWRIRRRFPRNTQFMPAVDPYSCGTRAPARHPHSRSMRPTKLPATPSPAVAEVALLEKRWLTFLPNAGTRTIPESGGPPPGREQGPGDPYSPAAAGRWWCRAPPASRSGACAMRAPLPAAPPSAPSASLSRDREAKCEAKLTVNCGSCSQTLGAD